MLSLFSKHFFLVPEGEEAQTAATSMQEPGEEAAEGEGHPEGEGEEGEEGGEGVEEETVPPEEVDLEAVPTGEEGDKSPSVAETIASKTTSKEGSLTKQGSVGSKQPSQVGVAKTGSQTSQGTASQGKISQGEVSQGPGSKAVSKETIGGAEAGEVDKATSPIAPAEGEGEAAQAGDAGGGT